MTTLEKALMITENLPCKLIRAITTTSYVYTLELTLASNGKTKHCLALSIPCWNGFQLVSSIVDCNVLFSSLYKFRE